MPSPSRGARILVVDDAADTVEILKRNLERRGHLVRTAPGVLEAIEAIEQAPVDLVVTDIKMPGPSGQELIRYARENLKRAGVVVITGYPSFEGAVEAVKAGAEEYLIKPFTEEELFAAVERALDRLKRLHQVGEPRADHDRWASYGLIGKSRQLAEVLRAAARAAQNQELLLIQGESGCEKELLARAIHYEGPLAKGPFLALRCSSLPPDQIEGELFGSAAGSGTPRRPGLLQAARGGTLFLGELEHTGPSLQSRLAKLLPSRRGRGRPAEGRPPRLIVSTSEDLLLAVKRRAFDRDLHQALSVQQIDLPPLRERNDDVIVALQHFATHYAAAWKRKPLRFTDAALQVLWNYRWPGNTWELRRLIGQLEARVEGGVVDVPDLPSHMRFRIALRRDVGLKRTLEEVEAEHIRNVLVNEGGNRARAAEILRIDRKTLREKLRRYRISG